MNILDLGVVSKIAEQNFCGSCYCPENQIIVYSSGGVLYYKIFISDLQDPVQERYWNDRLEKSTVMDECGYYGWRDILNCLTANGILH